MIDLVPVKVHNVFTQQSDDTTWCDFIIPVLNMAGLTTADIRFDIWEVDDPDDPRIEAFAERVFELFLEGL
jgi:hypothetical protein